MKYHYENQLKIKYVYISLASIFILGVLLFLTLSFYDIKYGLLEIIAFATGTTAIFTLVYHSLSLEERIESQIAQNQIMRSQYTYEMISKWNTRELFESVMVFKELITDEINEGYLEDPKSVSKFEDILNMDLTGKRTHFVIVMNYCEVICSMVKKGDIDSELIRYAFRDLFIYYYKIVKNYIDFRQKEHPAAYYNFEEISKLWINENKVIK